jgi:AAA domain
VRQSAIQEFDLHENFCKMLTTTTRLMSRHCSQCAKLRLQKEYSSNQWKQRNKNNHPVCRSCLCSVEKKQKGSDNGANNEEETVQGTVQDIISICSTSNCNSTKRVIENYHGDSHTKRSKSNGISNNLLHDDNVTEATLEDSSSEEYMQNDDADDQHINHQDISSGKKHVITNGITDKQEGIVNHTVEDYGEQLHELDSMSSSYLENMDSIELFLHDALLQNVNDDNTCPIGDPCRGVLVCGLPGVGKLVAVKLCCETIVRVWQTQYRSEPEPIIFHFNAVSLVNQTDLLGTIKMNLCDALDLKTASECTDANIDSKLHNRSLVLVIDEIDALDWTRTTGNLLKMILELANKNIPKVSSTNLVVIGISNYINHGAFHRICKDNNVSVATRTRSQNDNRF